MTSMRIWGSARSRRIWMLCLVVLLAGALRLVNLGGNPNGFYHDEAVWGFDGYSIGQTGRDLYGVFMPVFGEVSEGGRWETQGLYLIALSTKFFGLNEFAVRLPFALVGFFSVLILYFLVKKIFDWKVGLLAAFFLAISPWHIQFSRISFFHILTIFYFLLGLLFFISAIRHRPWHLYISGLMFLGGLWTYQSARVFIPLFLVGLVVIFWNELRRIWPQALGAGLLFSLSALPLLLFWISPDGMGRASSQLHLDLFQNFSWYLSYFGPGFLFLKGDPNIRHHIVGGGQLYFFEAATLAGGILWILRRFEKKEHRMLTVWLLLFPLPAAFTQPGHALRSLMGAPLFAILSAVGVFALISLVRSRAFEKAVKCLTAGVVLISFGVYVVNYFFQYPRYSARSWEYGVREAITFTEEAGYDRVNISDSYYAGLWLILFYGRVDPLDCQRNARRWYAARSIGRYHLKALLNAESLRDGGIWMMNPLEVEILVKAGYPLRLLHVVTGPTGSPEVVLAALGK